MGAVTDEFEPWMREWVEVCRSRGWTDPEEALWSYWVVAHPNEPAPAEGMLPCASCARVLSIAEILFRPGQRITDPAVPVPYAVEVLCSSCAGQPSPTGQLHDFLSCLRRPLGQPGPAAVCDCCGQLTWRRAEDGAPRHWECELR